MTSLKAIPRKSDVFIPRLTAVKVTKIFSPSDMVMYSSKLGQMGEFTDNEGVQMRFIIWQKSIYSGAKLLKLNKTYDILEVFTSDMFGEISIQLNKNSLCTEIRKQVSDYIDLGKIAYDSKIERKSRKPINVAVADSSLLRKPFTFRGVVK